MPLFAAVVGWKDGAGVGVPDTVAGGGADEDEVMDVSVATAGGSLDGEDEEDEDDGEEDVVDEADVKSSSPVDDGAGPTPSTLFGHR